MLLYATLVVCAAVMGWLVYRYDLHDREPVSRLGLAVALGAAGMYVAGRAQVWVLTMLGPWAARHWNASVSTAAGLSEEAAKLICVCIVARSARRLFNDPMDGLIYGSFVGLGTAIEESVAMLAGQEPLRFLPVTEPVRLMGHLVMGGIGAAGLGPWSVGHPAWRWMAPAGWLGAVALHTGWDLVAFSAADAGSMKAWHTAASMALMLGGLLAYRALLGLLEPMSRTHFGRRASADVAAAEVESKEPSSEGSATEPLR